MIRINYDALGIAASLACAIHCALLPLVLTSLPFLGINIINNVAFEYFMIALAMAVGYHSLWHGFKKHHHRPAPLFVFTLGICLMLLKQMFHTYQFYFLVPAVIAIVVAHIMNFRLCRKDGCRH